MPPATDNIQEPSRLPKTALSNENARAASLSDGGQAVTVDDLERALAFAQTEAGREKARHVIIQTGARVVSRD